LHAGFRSVAVFCCVASAYASGTITPASRVGGYNRCAASTVEGVVTAVDAESRILTVKTAKGEMKKLKADDQTRFRVPGAAKEDLRVKPMSTVAADAKAKISYCTKDDTLVEVRVLK
jgi:hypothetical protein